MKKVVLILAPGFEEIEALTVVDVLRRGEVEVIVAGLVEGPITGRNQITVLADCTLDEVEPGEYDMVVLPGGPGTKNLRDDPRVERVVKAIYEAGKLTAAICAAPAVLAAIGLLDGKRVTSFPAVRDQLTMTDYSEDRVVIDGNIITSRGPGTAMEFSMALLEQLCGREKMEAVNAGVMARLG